MLCLLSGLRPADAQRAVEPDPPNKKRLAVRPYSGFPSRGIESGTEKATEEKSEQVGGEERVKDSHGRDRHDIFDTASENNYPTGNWPFKLSVATIPAERRTGVKD